MKKDTLGISFKDSMAHIGKWQGNESIAKQAVNLAQKNHFSKHSAPDAPRGKKFLKVSEHNLCIGRHRNLALWFNFYPHSYRNLHP